VLIIIIIIPHVLSHDYSHKLDDVLTLSGETKKLRNYRPSFELREQFLYNNAVWLSRSPILIVSKGET
jgi:hypothetical protein